MQRLPLVCTAALCILLTAATALYAGSTVPDDRAALKGLQQVKAVFDVRLAELDKLLFNLELVRETWEGISNQQIKPQLVVTLRGPAVKLFTSNQATPELKELLTDLKKKGIRIEICSVATRVFKVDTSRLIPEVFLVGNVLTTQIALQNKGYALITLN